ncbi:hypothetical protein [Rhizobium aouanii]|uniref:Uncharacterized protein n=1 Tax=Rhizobium aouanii TaxID=3118145 RepID=A0ABU8CFN3_9HYPH
MSTKTDSLALAKEFAEDWYLELRGKSRVGQLKQERTFADAAKQFVREYVPLTNGERNPRYVKDHEARLDNHLLPYFDNIGLSDRSGGPRGVLGDGADIFRTSGSKIIVLEST